MRSPAAQGGEPRVDRAHLFLVGKCSHPAHGRSRVDARSAEQDLSCSLRRLGTAYLDVLLLHRDDERVPVQEVVRFMHKLVASGRARGWGVSNWAAARTRAAVAFAEGEGLSRPVVSSPQASLCTPARSVWPGTTHLAPGSGSDEELLYAEEGLKEGGGLSVLGWSPLGGSFLAGEGEGEGGEGGAFDTALNRERRARAKAFGEARGLTTAQVAVAYAVGQAAGYSAFAVAGTACPRHLAEMAAATAVRLTRKEVRFLRSG
jgi:aryl-alcohol dehydrogenase-like predicted oxidoreductase